MIFTYFVFIYGTIWFKYFKKTYFQRLRALCVHPWVPVQFLNHQISMQYVNKVNISLLLGQISWIFKNYTIFGVQLYFKQLLGAFLWAIIKHRGRVIHTEAILGKWFIEAHFPACPKGLYRFSLILVFCHIGASSGDPLFLCRDS